MSDSIVKSDKPSWVQAFVEKAHGAVKPVTPPEPQALGYLKSTGQAAIDYGVSGVVGALLGAAHAQFGLNPALCAGVAGAGFAGAVALSKVSPWGSAVVRQAGAQAFGLGLFLKSYEAVKGQPLTGSKPGVQHLPAPKAAAGTGPGIAGEDPIERVARNLG